MVPLCSAVRTEFSTTTAAAATATTTNVERLTTLWIWLFWEVIEQKMLNPKTRSNVKTTTTTTTTTTTHEQYKNLQIEETWKMWRWVVVVVGKKK